MRFSLTETAAAIGVMKEAINNFYLVNGMQNESYDFYSWAMMSNAAITMTTKAVSVKDGTTTVSVPIADYVSNGTDKQPFNGRLAFSQGSNYFNLRNNGTNNASSGLLTSVAIAISPFSTSTRATRSLSVSQDCHSTSSLPICVC